MFWCTLETHADRIALIDEGGRHISYGALAALADDLALPRDGAKALVLLEMDNSVASIAAYLGVLRAGHAALLVNHGSALLSANLIETYSPEFQWTPHTGLARLVPQDAAATLSPIHHDLAVLLSTSGSTGAAKTVRISHQALEANARQICAYLAIDADERAITTLPPAYSYGLSVINTHLRAGASIVLNEHSVATPEFREVLTRFAATSLAGVPYTYEMLIASGFLDHWPESLRSLTQAGGRLAPDLVRKTGLAAKANGARFCIMYGQTEATARMAYLPPDMVLDHADCIGRVIPEGRFELHEVESDEESASKGELVYFGPNIMMGYGTARADLAKGAEIDCLHTGDIAELAQDGIYRIVGRKSRFIKLFGLRVALDEVEALAQRHGQRAIATGDDTGLVVAVEGDCDVDALVDRLTTELKLPRQSAVGIAMPALPRLDNGKLDYGAIRRLAREKVAAQAQNGSALDGYRALLAQIAGRKDVPDTTSFADVGGDSLTYVQAAMLLERALGELPQDWEGIDIATLAQMTPKPVAVGDAVSAPQDVHNFKYIQLMRTVAILLVIASHTVSVAGRVTGVDGGEISATWFRHINLMFIFVAGYLFQFLIPSFAFASFLRLKAATVVLPYAVVSVPALIVYGVMGHPNAQVLPEWIDSAVERVGYFLLTGGHLGPLWFVPVIVLIYLTTPLWVRMNRIPWLYLLLVPMIIAAVIVGRDELNGNPLRSFAFFLPSFLLGMLVSHYRDNILPILARSWWALVPFYFLHNLFPVPDLIDDGIAMLGKLIFTLGVVGFLYRYASYAPTRWQRIGELSFGIYFIHGYIVAAVRPFSKQVLFENASLPVTVIVFIAVFTVVAALAWGLVEAIKRIIGPRSRYLIGA